MSLMRRRAMMAEQKQEEKVIYIDSGFLDASVRFDEQPIFNASYPDAWATTYAPAQKGDRVVCRDLLNALNGFTRIRQYYTNGNQTRNSDAGADITITSDDVAYVRVMLIQITSIIPSELTITHPDGTIDTYKIIDRR